MAYVVIFGPLDSNAKNDQVGESCRDWTGASIGIMLAFVMYCVDSAIRGIHFSVAENCYPPQLVEL